MHLYLSGSNSTCSLILYNSKLHRTSLPLASKRNSGSLDKQNQASQHIILRYYEYTVCSSFVVNYLCRDTARYSRRVLMDLEYPWTSACQFCFISSWQDNHSEKSHVTMFVLPPLFPHAQISALGERWMYFRSVRLQNITLRPQTEVSWIDPLHTRFGQLLFPHQSTSPSSPTSV